MFVTDTENARVLSQQHNVNLFRLFRRRIFLMQNSTHPLPL
jgi:hypothetical protein